MDELLHKEFKEVGIFLSSITLSKGMQPKNLVHFLFRQSWVPCDNLTYSRICHHPKLGLSHVSPLDPRKIAAEIRSQSNISEDAHKATSTGSPAWHQGASRRKYRPPPAVQGIWQIWKAALTRSFHLFFGTDVSHSPGDWCWDPNPHSAQIMSQIPGACWGEFDILHGLTDSASCDHWILLRFNALWGNPTRITTSQISKWHNTRSYSGVTSSKGKFYIENWGMADDDIAITLRWLNHTLYFYKQSGLIPSVLQPQSQPQFSITTAVWSKTCILNQSVNKAICCTHNFVTIHCSNVW